MKFGRDEVFRQPPPVCERFLNLEWKRSPKNPSSKLIQQTITKRHSDLRVWRITCYMSCSTCFPDVFSPWCWLQQDFIKKELSGCKEIHQCTRSHGSLKTRALKQIDSHERKARKRTLPTNLCRLFLAPLFQRPFHLEVLSLNTSRKMTPYVCLVKCSLYE